MITYALNGIYYATMNVGRGLNRQSFHASSDTRGQAIVNAIIKYEYRHLQPNNDNHSYNV